jgi:pimeloyl-ACP methyl ester carboxylesterase
MQPDSLAPAKDKMPLFLAHGDADTVVPTDVGRRWAKTATDLKMKDFKYMEIPGADHGTVITQAMPNKRRSMTAMVPKTRARPMT